MWKALPYLLAMAAVIPLAGLAVTGSWRAAWEYTKTWCMHVAALAVVGLLLALIMPH